MRAALLSLLLIACHHDSPAPKMEPGETAPLPPSSGTPIGVLVDAGADLKLRDDQLAKLRELDEATSARNESLDAQSRADHPPDASASPPTGGRHRGGGMRSGGGMGGGGMGGGGMGGGGMRSGGGMGGGMGGPPSGSGRHHEGAGAGSGSPPTASSARAEQEKLANNRDALARAFAILDPDQRVAAKKLLDDRGIDVSAIETGADAEP